MSVAGGPYVIRDSSLILEFDAADLNSYITGSTIWYDLSPNSYTGSLTNGPSFSFTNAGSISFDGVNNFVTITNPSVLQSQNLSISVWINIQTPANAITDILDYDHTTPGQAQGWVLQSEDATTNRFYYFAYYDGSAFQPAGNFSAGKGVQITYSTWSNLIYTKGGTSVVGYLNGIRSYSATATNANVSYIANKNIKVGGAVSGSNSRPYKGNMAIVQVYNRALTSAEVVQNYNAQKGRFGLR